MISTIRNLFSTISKKLIPQVIPVSVSVGDKVLLPEYGGTKLTLDDEVCGGR